MGISFKKEHLKRYKDVASLLLKYGDSDLVKNAGLEEALVRGEKPLPEPPGYRPLIADPLAGPTKAAPDAKPALAADKSSGTAKRSHDNAEQSEEKAKPFRLPQGGYGYSTDLICNIDEKTNNPDETQNFSPINAPDPSEEAAKAKSPEEFAKDLERLGPTFIKVGQLLSTRADFLPPAYLQALTRLQDNCEPFSYAEVEQIVVNELGVRISKAFTEFDSEPIAAASLGQIHRAVLRDGREVAVKVQRPGIREQVIKDLEALADVAEFYDKHTKAGQKYQFGVILDELRKSVMEELDYRKEAHNLETLKSNLQEFKLIEVPSPISNYSTGKVLTMEFVQGKKITAITNLERIEIDGEPLAEEIFRAYLKQILNDGFFHADPHPGNVFLTKENKIALIDLGMVARLTPYMQGKLFLMLLAIAEGRADVVANIAIDIGEPKANYDEQQFKSRVTALVQGHLEKNLNEMDLGVVIVGVTQIAGDCGIKVPAELTMLGKTLLNLDLVGSTLDPNFNPNESMKRNAPRIMQQRMEKSLSMGNIFSALVEAKDFIEKLPGTVHKIMDLVASNNVRVKVDAIDEAVLVESAQKIANRVTIGLVIAALIMGASNLMQVHTSFTLFGYPGLAMICFLLAAGAGFGLIIHIAIYDQHGKKSQ